jgi:hypothetical protein
MSAYRGERKRRPAEPEKPPRAPRTELIVAVIMLALGGLLLAMLMMRRDRPTPAPTVTREPVAMTSAEPSPPVVSVPTRPASLSERQHLATNAAISLANAAMLGNRDAIARLAMTMADAITNPEITCGEYDAAYVGLRKAVLALPDAGDLGDVTSELADIDAARCQPGSDAGG